MATAPARRVPHGTHEVVNQPPPLLDHNAFDADPALGEALSARAAPGG